MLLRRLKTWLKNYPNNSIKYQNTTKRYYTIFTNLKKTRISPNRTKNISLNRTFSQVENKEKSKDDIIPNDPLMYEVVLKYLNLAPKSTIIDMTFGSGGHSEKILQTFEDVKIFALDRDPVAHKCAQQLAEKYPNQVIPLLGKFSDLPKLLEEHQVLDKTIDAFFFDFGCSEMQMNDLSRGFAVSKQGLLDMRMDGDRNPGEPTVANVLECIDELDLTRILRTYGNEKRGNSIAKSIIETRYGLRSLKTTKDLVNLLESLLGVYALDNLDVQSHTAFKTFQALRIFVNNELNENNYALLLANLYLKLNGRCITLTYTTLEDMIVKQHLTGRINNNLDQQLLLKYSNYDKSFTELEMASLTESPWKMLHKHVLKVPKEQVDLNPKLWNVRFRALEKVKHMNAITRAEW